MSDTPLESWLRDALFNHPWDLIHSAFPRDFESDSVPSLSRWKEFQTAVGRIDLLLAYPGRVVVVELKRTVIDEGAIAQCLRYIGAIRKEFIVVHTSAKTKLSGIVAAPSITDGARFAAMAAGIAYAEIKPAVEVVCDYSTPFVEPRMEIECKLLDITAPGFRAQRARVSEINHQLRDQGIVPVRDAATYEI